MRVRELEPDARRRDEKTWEIGSVFPPFDGHEERRRLITMVPLLLVLLLALILFGAGFALKALWWIAVIVLVIWLLGFVIRSADSGGRKGRWYRW
jgi:small-conductance mechanosensitive channel